MDKCGINETKDIDIGWLTIFIIGVAYHMKGRFHKIISMKLSTYPEHLIVSIYLKLYTCICRLNYRGHPCEMFIMLLIMSFNILASFWS